MAYTAMLNMLDLGGLPLRAEDRPGLTPLVIAGGSAALYSPPVYRAGFCTRGRMRSKFLSTVILLFWGNFSFSFVFLWKELLDR